MQDLYSNMVKSTKYHLKELKKAQISGPVFLTYWKTQYSNTEYMGNVLQLKRPRSAQCKGGEVIAPSCTCTQPWTGHEMDGPEARLEKTLVFNSSLHIIKTISNT